MKTDELKSHCLKKIESHNQAIFSDHTEFKLKFK